jgi:lipase ATG15
VFFSSTWAVGTFVYGGDFKVYPPTGNATVTANVLGNVSEVWGKLAKYPVCSLDLSTLDIVDFALIADSVYGYNTSVQYESFAQRFWGTDLADWQYVKRNDENDSHQVWVELFFPTINMTVVAVRGTATATDALEDLHYWFGVSIMQAANVFVPFLKQLPTMFVVQMLSLNILSSVVPAPVYTELLDHVISVKQRVGDNLVLTGHSLGGAMAAMVGAKTKTPAVSFSGPGLLYTRGRFGIDDQDIRDYVLTIKPRRDIVPQIDELAGMVQEIECRRTNPLACHSTSTHLCELYASCGDRRNRDWSYATQCLTYMEK